MNSIDRHDLIVRTLAERGVVPVHRAVQLTSASPATIRRDFTELVQEGIARRVRGGIRQIQSEGMTPFAMRQVQYSQEKDLLCRRAVAMLKPDDVVIIDGGTTTFHLGACLPQMPLHIITNSLQLASFLDDKSRRRPEWEIFLTGGFLHPNSGLLVGPGAQSSIAQYHANWAFLSVGGITADGLFNTTELVVETERLMIANADRVVVLADHSKIGQHAMCHVCTLDQIDCLITDQNPGSDLLLQQCRNAGVEVVTV